MSVPVFFVEGLGLALAAKLRPDQPQTNEKGKKLSGVFFCLNEAVPGTRTEGRLASMRPSLNMHEEHTVRIVRGEMANACSEQQARTDCTVYTFRIQHFWQNATADQWSKRLRLVERACERTLEMSSVSDVGTSLIHVVYVAIQACLLCVGAALFLFKAASMYNVGQSSFFSPHSRVSRKNRWCGKQ